MPEYTERLRKYFQCSLECFLLAFIYIDRVVTLNRNVIGLGRENIHRLLLASLTVATKYWDDMYLLIFFYSSASPSDFTDADPDVRPGQVFLFRLS